MHITPHTRKALYRVTAIIICFSFLVNASPVVAGPDMRAATRPVDRHHSWGNPRPTQSDTSVIDSWNKFWRSHFQPEPPDWNEVWDWVLTLRQLWEGSASATEEHRANRPAPMPSPMAYALMTQSAAATATPSPQPEQGSNQDVPQDILPPGQTTDLAPPNLVTLPQLAQPPFDELFLVSSWNLLFTPKKPLHTDPATFFSAIDGNFN